MNLPNHFVLLTEARNALERGSYTSAFDKLSSLLSIATDQSLCKEVFALLGVTRAYMGDEDGAIEAFSNSIQVSGSTRHFEFLPYRFFCDMEDLIWIALNDTDIRSGYGYPYGDDGFSLRSERMDEESSRRGEKRIPTWEEEERIARSAIRSVTQYPDVGMSQAAILDGENEVGIEMLQRLATQHNAEAAYELGCLYASEINDKGKELDAVTLLATAADAGLLKAQMKLAVLLGDESRECYEPAKSAMWMMKVAEAGDSNGQLQLATKLMTGNGIQIDNSKAAMWLGKSAVSGNQRAQFLLGHLLYEGKGVDQDIEAAKNLWLACVNAGMPQAAYQLGVMCMRGHRFLDNFQSSIIFENELDYWLQKAAMNGYPEAQYLLGIERMRGEHLEENLHVAYRWLSNAVANGIGAAVQAIELLRGEIGEAEFEELSEHKSPIILWSGWQSDPNDATF